MHTKDELSKKCIKFLFYEFDGSAREVHDAEEKIRNNKKSDPGYTRGICSPRVIYLNLKVAAKKTYTRRFVLRHFSRET